MDNENNNFQQAIEEKEALNYFLDLKNKYALERTPFEKKWEQARASCDCDYNKLERIYEGRAQIITPIMKWKSRGVSARINRIIFNTAPFARIEPVKISERKKLKNIIELWNKYIFDCQLSEINFMRAYKLSTKLKTIYGTNIAKITHEYSEKILNYFDEDEVEKYPIKDNTYWRNILITEFYSDINKTDINESQASIHTTVMSWEELKNNEKKTYYEEVEYQDPATGETVIKKEKKTEGFYHNLDLIDPTGNNITEEQEVYMQSLGISSENMSATLEKIRKENKTGYIPIDECYGKYWIKNEEGEYEWKEAICVIANGTVIIRGPEQTPFVHKKYVRPFVVCRYETKPGCLYGDSNVIAGLNLHQELNATRAQALDAKTRSISNMWYLDTTKNINWNNIWKPNGIVKGSGPNGLVPLLNPYLGHISINDTMKIEKDIDDLFALSPIQQGTSDERLIPATVGGTAMLISQNDIVLNEVIAEAIDTELKPFLEMLFERNLRFKKFKDLLKVWDIKDVRQYINSLLPDEEKFNPDEEIPEELVDAIPMKKLYFDAQFKIMGNLELSNEIAHQKGYESFAKMAQVIPPIAQRVDWRVFSDKVLRSYGIKDDSTDLFIDDEALIKARQEQKKIDDEKEKELLSLAEQQKQLEIQEYSAKKAIDANVEIKVEQAKSTLNVNEEIQKMAIEAQIEKSSGQKVR